MANSTNQILNKSLSELRKKQASLFKEIENISTAISSIENILTPAPEKVGSTKTKNIRRHSSPKITEKSVREAILNIVNNPPIGNQRFKPLPGFFTSKYIYDELGLKSNYENLQPILDKFVEKKMLESKPYKRGRQYRYIHPTETGPGSQFEKIKNNISKLSSEKTSAPIPGTGKNGITLRNKDVEKMVSLAKAQGFAVERLGSDHLRISKNGKIATISTTGADKARYVENCKADLKRIGVIL